MGLRIHVGMMSCGENERDRAIEAVQAQIYSDYEFFLIENRPNKEAHEALYERFTASADQFQIFLKLDADIVLRRPTAFHEVASFFSKNPEIGLLLFELIDWYSDSLVPGIVITRNSARWPKHSDQLMVDSYVSVPGKVVTVSNRDAALAVHSPDPSPLQAFRFGIHRAMKALQFDRPVAQRMVEKAHGHHAILVKTWANFVVRRDRRMGLAVAGAELVVNRALGSVGNNYMSRAVEEIFAMRYADATADSLFTELARGWTDTVTNQARWQAALAAKEL
jgi:hypothetical protein